MKSKIVILVPFALLFAHAACGGKVAVDAPGEGSGGATTPTGAGGATASTGTGIDSTSSGFGAASSTSSGFSTTSSTSSGFGTTSSTSSGFTTTSSSSSSSSSTTSSSSSSGSAVTVFCNGGPCMPGDICCFNPTGPGDHCGQAGQCDPGYVEFSCNGPNDCPGSICCATLDPGTMGLSGISCQQTCGAPNELVVCNMMSPDVCPAGTACHGAQQLGAGQGYRFCTGG